MTKNGNPQDNPLYKTKICSGWNIIKEKRTCTNSPAKCFYAHGEDDQRPCIFFAKGCKNGDQCAFKHPQEEKKRNMNTSFKDHWDKDIYRRFASASRKNHTRGSTNKSVDHRTYKEVAASKRASDKDSTKSTSSTSFQNVYFGDRKTCDFFFQVGQARYHIHKAVVAPHSSKFDALFRQHPEKDCKELQGTDPTGAVKDVFQIIYKFNLDEKCETIGDLDAYITRATAVLLMGDEFKVPAVRRYYDSLHHPWLCTSTCLRCTTLENLKELAKTGREKQDPMAKKFAALYYVLCRNASSCPNTVSYTL